MQWVKEHKSWVGYFVALLLFLVTFFFTYYINTNLDNYIHKVEQSNHDINRLDDLFGKMKQYEINFRNNLIKTGNVPKDSFFTGVPQIKQLFDSLANSSKNGDAIAAKELRIRFDSSYMYGMQMLNEMSNANGEITPAYRLVSFKRVSNYNKIYTLLFDLRTIKKDQLMGDYVNLQKTSTTIKFVIIVLLIISTVLAFYAFINYHKEYKAKKKSDSKTAEYQKELEARVIELANANKELSSLRSIEKFAATGRVARTIAHEVRNPLTNINLAADQLQQQLKEAGVDGDTEVLLNMIFRNSNRINAMISDLLNSTKATELKYTTVAITTVLDEVIETAKDRINLREVKIIRDYKDSCLIEMDEEKLKIAFLNIIINAMESMEEKGGELIIATDVVDNKCVISITDNGIGMDEEALNHVFEAYYTTKQKGSGLGMTNTQNIIISHKGEINIVSQPGIGTTFSIALNSKA